MDIERHLAERAGASRGRRARLYRFRRLVRRHKGTFAAITLILVALLIGLAVSTALFFREKAARKDAIAAQRSSESAAIKSEEVAVFFRKCSNKSGLK